MRPPPPRSTLFPYTTLFRSLVDFVMRSTKDLTPKWVQGRDGKPVDRQRGPEPTSASGDRKSTRLNSSHVKISYAVFCLKKKRNKPPRKNNTRVHRHNAFDTA